MSQNQTPSTFAAPDAGQGNAYAVPAAAGSGAVDLGAVLSGMWQRKLLMLSIFAVIVLGVTAFVFTATPKYTAVAKVLIEGPSSPYRAPDLGPNQRNADERVGEREVYSQAEVIESRDLAAQVAKKLNLSSLAEFSRSAGSSPISSLLSAAGLSGGSQSGGSEQRATTKLMKNLSVYPVNRSSVIKVEYESESPETAAAVVNALTDAYLGTMRDLRRDDTAGAVGWLNEQIAELEGKVRDIENKVEQHRASAGLVRGHNARVRGQIGRTKLGKPPPQSDFLFAQSLDQV